ncbi:MAG: hypothetical protein OXP09_08335, partial [Gammaproteobacteria bacterium]|nr:hypothetical protein [Gammaproteobacteria bacterium]
MVDAIGNRNAQRPAPGPAGTGKAGKAARSSRLPDSSATGAVPGADEGLITFMGDGGDGSVPALALPRNMDADVMMTLLYAIQQKQGQDRIKTSEMRIEDKKAQRQEKHEEIMHKIKKMHEAEKKGGVGKKVGMAFGWIGVGLSWIAVGVVA